MPKIREKLALRQQFKEYLNGYDLRKEQGMVFIGKEHVSGILDKNVKAAAVCESGQTVVFETRDCYDDGVVSEERPLGDKADPIENPATGPLYIEGALPGDILKVEILDIQVRNWAVMRSSTSCGVFHEDFSERTARIFKLDNLKQEEAGAQAVEKAGAAGRGDFRFDDVLKLELDPMIGVIGTAPAGDGITTDTPDSHGGNMDCRKIVKGSVLYLPVYAEGALLSMGDLHALMGDGEVLICGLETGGAVTVKVTVLKEKELKGVRIPVPFLSCRGDVMTIQSARTLDEAGDMAAKAMKEFVKAAAKKDNLEAGMLMSLLSNMAVCQVVDPLKTVRVEFPLHVLESYGYKLP